MRFELSLAKGVPRGRRNHVTKGSPADALAIQPGDAIVVVPMVAPLNPLAICWIGWRPNDRGFGEPERDAWCGATLMETTLGTDPKFQTASDRGPSRPIPFLPIP